MIFMMVMLIMITIRIMNVEYIWLSSLNAMRIKIYSSIWFQSAEIRSMFPAWPLPALKI